MQEVSLNNNETNTPTLKSNAINVVTKSDETTFNHVPQRIKFVLNVPNGAILPKCVAQGDRNNEEEKEATESESQGTELDPVAFADFTSKNGWKEYHVDNFSKMAISEAFEIKHATNLSEDDLNGHIIEQKTKTEDLYAIADSGSPLSFLKGKPPGGYKRMAKPQYQNKFQRKLRLGI